MPAPPRPIPATSNAAAASPSAPPGHSDFIAQVERALGVLDGAVLVLSAVEGVQPHTRILMRILRDLQLPTLFFVNKIDRVGARGAELVADIAGLLTPRVTPLGTVRGIGTAAADFVPYRRRDPAFRAALATVLAEHDDALLAELVAGVTPSSGRLWTALRQQTAAATAYPLMFGCALSGAGVAALLDGIRRLLPPVPAAEDGLRGRVFAIERGNGGDKVAYVRSYGGRQRVTVHRREPDGQLGTFRGQITALHVVGDSSGTTPQLTAGYIGRIRGLSEVRIGDHASWTAERSS